MGTESLYKPHDIFPYSLLRTSKVKLAAVPIRLMDDSSTPMWGGGHETNVTVQEEPRASGETCKIIRRVGVLHRFREEYTTLRSKASSQNLSLGLIDGHL